MLKMAMSRAASGLLRALIERLGGEPDRILLSDVRSVDWQSLTFSGETHAINLRVCGPGAGAAVAHFAHGIEDAEFAIPGHLVADIVIAGAPVLAQDGSVALAIEALTVAE